MKYFAWSTRLYICSPYDRLPALLVCHSQPAGRAACPSGGGVDVRQHLIQSDQDTREAGAGRRISRPAGGQQVGQLLGKGPWNFGAEATIDHFRYELFFSNAFEGHLAGQHLPKDDAEAVHVHFLVVWLSLGNLTHTDRSLQHETKQRIGRQTLQHVTDGQTSGAM